MHAPAKEPFGLTRLNDSEQLACDANASLTSSSGSQECSVHRPLDLGPLTTAHEWSGIGAPGSHAFDARAEHSDTGWPGRLVCPTSSEIRTSRSRSLVRPGRGVVAGRSISGSL